MGMTTKISYIRESTEDEWEFVDEEEVSDNWDSFVESMDWFRNLGGTEILEGDRLTSVSPNGLEMCVYIKAS
jgi:hypothetical protein